MKNLLHTLAACLFFVSGIASAQTPYELVQEIKDAAADACVSAVYSLNAKVDDALIKDKGTVVAQDDIWVLKGQSIEIHTCADGTWILHPESKEAMIEPKWSYGDLESFYRTLSSASSNVISISLMSKDLTEKKPISFYDPQIGYDWIVTDLR